MIANFMQPEELSRLRSLELRARAVVEGYLQGMHRSPFVGFSVEFSSHRKYEAGDDLRHVNWKLYARNRKLYVKEFDAETNMNLYLLVDNTASMNCKAGGPMSKRDYASVIAASLSHVGMRQRDSVALAMLGDGIQTYLDPSAKPQQWQDCLRVLQTTPVTVKSSLGRSLQQCALLAKSRGLVVLISDLIEDLEHDPTEEIEQGLERLRFQGHEVVVFHVLDPWERSLPKQGRSRFIDPESAFELTSEMETIRVAYGQRIDAWTKKLESICLDQRIDRIELTTDTPPSRALVDYLVKRTTMG